MLCYRDQSYCNSSNTCATECPRRVTEEIRAAAQERKLGICYMSMRGRDGCPGYTEKTSEVSSASAE